MKKLLLVLAAAAAPAWACIDPEQEFEDCALYSGTCQRVKLSNCKLQKLGFVDEAECSALAAAKAGKRRKKKNAKFITKWCPEQSEDELKFLCEGENKCVARKTNGELVNKGKNSKACEPGKGVTPYACPTYENLLEQLQELEEHCCTCEPTPGPTTSPTSSEPTTSPTPGPTPSPTPGPSPGPTQVPVHWIKPSPTRRASYEA